MSEVKTHSVATASASAAVTVAAVSGNRPSGDGGPPLRWIPAEELKPIVSDVVFNKLHPIHVLYKAAAAQSAAYWRKKAVRLRSEVDSLLLQLEADATNRGLGAMPLDNEERDHLKTRIRWKTTCAQLAELHEAAEDKIGKLGWDMGRMTLRVAAHLAMEEAETAEETKHNNSDASGGDSSDDDLDEDELKELQDNEAERSAKAAKLKRYLKHASDAARLARDAAMHVRNAVINTAIQMVSIYDTHRSPIANVYMSGGVPHEQHSDGRVGRPLTRRDIDLFVTGAAALADLVRFPFEPSRAHGNRVMLDELEKPYVAFYSAFEQTQLDLAQLEEARTDTIRDKNLPFAILRVYTVRLAVSEWLPALYNNRWLAEIVLSYSVHSEDAFPVSVRWQPLPALCGAQEGLAALTAQDRKDLALQERAVRLIGPHKAKSRDLELYAARLAKEVDRELKTRLKKLVKHSLVGEKLRPDQLTSELFANRAAAFQRLLDARRGKCYAMIAEIKSGINRLRMTRRTLPVHQDALDFKSGGNGAPTAEGVYAMTKRLKAMRIDSASVSATTTYIPPFTTAECKVLKQFIPDKVLDLLRPLACYRGVINCGASKSRTLGLAYDDVDPEYERAAAKSDYVMDLQEEWQDADLYEAQEGGLGGGAILTEAQRDVAVKKEIERQNRVRLYGLAAMETD